MKRILLAIIACGIVLAACGGPVVIADCGSQGIKTVHVTDGREITACNNGKVFVGGG